MIFYGIEHSGFFPNAVYISHTLSFLFRFTLSKWPCNAGIETK